MRKLNFYVFALFIFSSLSYPVYSQSTFNTIQTIMQSNCSASGCHGGTSPNVFDVNASEADLYNALVSAAPVNPKAEEKGYKLVDPGHPYNSFLMKKVYGGIDDYLHLDLAEGEAMPKNSPPLNKYEIELIRQWILAGAPESGTVVNYQLLKDYYTLGGIDFIPAPAPPQNDKGIQVRMGPIFLAPNEEREYMKRENLHNTGMIKVKQANGYMAWESHHMLLFKQTASNNSTQGLRRVPDQATPFDGNSVLTSAWQHDGDFVLPEGTALFWEPNTMLDFDYHVRNYSQTEILPADFYLNVLYSEDPNPIEMHAALENNVFLVLPEGEDTRTATHIPGGTGERYIYLITSHTHKYGTDYDIFLRNPDGSKGEQIYEGFYNTDYTFDQGFYDWNHPAIRSYPELKPFKESDGLIYEVKWNVKEPLVTFSLTTSGEMMLFTYMYTTEPLKTTGVKDVNQTSDNLSVYPNPFQNSTEIRYDLEKPGKVQIEMFDMLGKKLTTLLDDNANAGSHSLNVSDKSVGNSAGVYFVTLTVDGNKISTKKITKL